MRKPTSIKAWANSSFFFYRYDYIAVYDLLDNQVGQRYCGSITSPVYKEVKGNVAVVVFHSDSTNSKKGFVLSYEAHTCLTSAKVEDWRMIWSTTSDIQSELCYLSTIITLIQLWRCLAAKLNPQTNSPFIITEPLHPVGKIFSWICFSYNLVKQQLF